MADTPFVIREAAGDDAEALTRLVAALNEHEGDPVDLFTVAHARADALPPDGLLTTYVAEMDGRMVGYAMVCDSYETAYGARGLYMADLFVEADARKLGIGRALVRACATEARRRGGTFVWWTSNLGNDVAHRFYTELGATTEAVKAHALFDDPFDAMVGGDEGRTSEDDA